MTLTLDLTRRARHRLAIFASTRPRLYYGLRRATGALDQLCVGPDTELVIEGYPRSANSTTVHRFLERQARPVQIAHHKHHAAQLLRAVELGLPAVALIRRPQDAALSYLALTEEVWQRKKIARRGTLTFHDVLASWLAFYQAIECLLDRLVIAPFPEVTQDVGGMIEALNERFGTEYGTVSLPPQSERKLGWHAMPNTIRDDIKHGISEDFRQALPESRRLRAVLDQSKRLHDRIVERHERHR
jgi:hypothetical protein